MAEVLIKIFQNVERPLIEMDNLDLSQLKTLIESLYDTIDYVWTSHDLASNPYPEERMSHFMHVCSTSLSARISNIVSGMDIWSGSFNDARMMLNECIKILKSW